MVDWLATIGGAPLPFPLEPPGSSHYVHSHIVNPSERKKSVILRIDSERVSVIRAGGTVAGGGLCQTDSSGGSPPQPDDTMRLDRALGAETAASGNLCDSLN
jgi:hypothetical protein